ncbi:MAG: nitrite reductase (NAD(P)H) small subunit [Bacteroidota bacterium]|nr:nitrite reductase (NAD(P)H) small subunit [Bacteroidota bacterium]MDP4234197.1 nitrite reductase (NAD(P)H) small subunit [Bacteroidota bacterium]MDP4243737.1 nitrite reductase (NAD(P)H) small subunit [Bacteroidota bacterium]MDP4287898.1 nitrite reductase (NAD(P)H) small subunit [Bacteroidota bacterium]
MNDFDEEALDAARSELNTEGSEQSLEYFYACQFAEIPPSGRRGKVVEVDDTEIAIFNIKGEILAISNLCPHEMSPVMAAGFVDCNACVVACPLHGWTFDLHTGMQIGVPGSIPVYDVRLDGEEVWLRKSSMT